MHTEFARGQMITQQVRAWDVLDDRVLTAMRLVPRERFVPLPLRDLAFADAEIPLGHGQYMLAPKVVGRILQALNIQPGARLLEIGTGSGYLSAVAAQLGATVRSLEILPQLTGAARQNLAACEVAGVEVVNADAFATEIGADYTHIVLTGSLPIYTDRFQKALHTGGRLFAVVGEAPLMEARLITRVADADWQTEVLFETEIDALTNAPRPTPFMF
jgi:protein-L-isoaspartate(D-aspartate) O-methyltransferase